MKIEKINDNQIRCTLTKSDLAQRAIKISELAYGSEKTKNLFKDMMRQAQKEVGFDAENIPLMIEAIPYSEHIVLIITKVEDPEELDTKFSKFAPSVRGEEPSLDAMIQDMTGSSDVLDLFRKIQNSINGQAAKQDPADTDDVSRSLQEKICEEEAENPNLTRMFTFSTLAQVNRLARLIGNIYQGTNSLYKDTVYSTYILLVTRGTHTLEDYNRFCNMLSEYGNMQKALPAAEHFLEEHLTPIIKDHALATLASL